MISDAADIFELKEGDIATLEQFGEKSAEKIVREIENKKRVALNRFIFSLGILHVGEETSQLLAEQAIEKFEIRNSKFEIADILKYFKNLSIAELQNIRDIGPKVAESIHGWFRESRNIRLLEKLDAAGISIGAVKKHAGGARLKGKTFVITGSLESMPRDEAKEKIRQLGGDVSESVSKKTSYVVVGNEPGSKYEKAKRLGVEVIDEKKFIDMIG